MDAVATLPGHQADYLFPGAGAIIAALTDLTFNLRGYAAVIGNNFLTALYLIMVKTTPSSSGLTTTGLLFYNSALSLPLLAAALLLSGEPAGVLAFPRLRSVTFQASSLRFARTSADKPAYPSNQRIRSKLSAATQRALLNSLCCKTIDVPSSGESCAQGTLAATAMLGLSINHSTFVCTRYNEPLMTSVAGNLKVFIVATEGKQLQSTVSCFAPGRRSNRASERLMLTGLLGAGAQNVLGTVIGALIFPDFRFHPLNVLGLALGMAGAVWYATQAALKVRDDILARRPEPVLLGTSVAAEWVHGAVCA